MFINIYAPTKVAFPSVMLILPPPDKYPSTEISFIWARPKRPMMKLIARLNWRRAFQSRHDLKTETATTVNANQWARSIHPCMRSYVDHKLR